MSEPRSARPQSFAALRAWWARLTPREQRLIGLLGIVAALVFLWIGILRPLDDALSRAKEDYFAALDRNGAVIAKVRAIKNAPNMRQGGAAVPLDAALSQAAGEAGLALDRNEPQGTDRSMIAIANAKPQALFGWLADLENAGIYADQLTAQVNQQNGLSVTATMKRAGK